MADSLHPVRAYRLGQTPPLSLDALAERVGVTKSSLSRIETGKLSLSQDLAIKLSRATGIPMRKLCPELAALFAPEPAE